MGCGSSSTVSRVQSTHDVARQPTPVTRTQSARSVKQELQVDPEIAREQSSSSSKNLKASRSNSKLSNHSVKEHPNTDRYVENESNRGASSSAKSQKSLSSSQRDTKDDTQDGINKSQGSLSSKGAQSSRPPSSLKYSETKPEQSNQSLCAKSETSLKVESITTEGNESRENEYDVTKSNVSLSSSKSQISTRADSTASNGIAPVDQDKEQDDAYVSKGSISLSSATSHRTIDGDGSVDPLQNGKQDKADSVSLKSKQSNSSLMGEVAVAAIVTSEAKEETLNDVSTETSEQKKALVIMQKKELTPEEKESLQNEFKEHVNIVIGTLTDEINYFENDEQPSQDVGWLPAWAVWEGHWRPEEWRKLYTDRCRERIKTFEYFNRRGRLHNDNINSGVDPNKCVFPLCPDWLKPEDLRWYYTEDYEVFDLTLEGEAWSVYESDVVCACDPGEIHACFTNQLQPWINDWEPFDIQIDGEAGWNVIESDLFKNDIITEDQQKVIEARAQRTDHEDKDRMTRRRNAMAKMFTKRYERDDDAILLAVQTWASTIASGEQHFLKLCEN